MFTQTLNNNNNIICAINNNNNNIGNIHLTTAITNSNEIKTNPPLFNV